jgi:hypothetical protein
MAFNFKLKIVDDVILKRQSHEIFDLHFFS